MKISRLAMENFMIFDHLDVNFSPDINVISGENSTGKTAVIKLLYSLLKGYTEACSTRGDVTKDKIEAALVEKLQGVFRPDNDAVGRLVNRRQGSSHTDISLDMADSGSVKIGFGTKREKHIDIEDTFRPDIQETSPVYIPPKEIISATENFGSLYSDYHIAFEETYYDLTRLLERPLRKGPNTSEQRRVLKSFEQIVNGTIIQKDKKFYLKVKGAGEFEMGLVSEGYRKIATIMYLILSGSLSKNAVLFWDEPETNMNPKMIRPLADAIIELSRMGVQVFVTTHDYFVQQCFNMAALYSNPGSEGEKPLKYNFLSLYKDENNNIRFEQQEALSDLTHNAVMEEFDSLYDREQEMLYGRN
jgi:hypothetical protein